MVEFDTFTVKAPHVFGTRVQYIWQQNGGPGPGIPHTTQEESNSFCRIASQRRSLAHPRMANRSKGRGAKARV